MFSADIKRDPLVPASLVTLVLTCTFIQLQYNLIVSSRDFVAATWNPSPRSMYFQNHGRWTVPGSPSFICCFVYSSRPSMSHVSLSRFLSALDIYVPLRSFEVKRDECTSEGISINKP